eukprot:1161229-Pelagomonas_calceolata.AAC.13
MLPTSACHFKQLSLHAPGNIFKFGLLLAAITPYVDQESGAYRGKIVKSACICLFVQGTMPACTASMGAAAMWRAAHQLACTSVFRSIASKTCERKRKKERKSSSVTRKQKTTQSMSRPHAQRKGLSRKNNDQTQWEKYQEGQTWQSSSFAWRLS